MNKLKLMRNPEVFQGEKRLHKNKKYFEGWYFKNTNGRQAISFIPGINIDDKEKKAFIQVITTEKSYFVDYSILEFEFSFKPFYIKIGDNLFSKEGIHIDIKDEVNDLEIYGDIKYYDSSNINTNFMYPNIMGPFSYIPFMECNHAILAMKNSIKGTIIINSEKITFDDGCGYIEKDWGWSFPKTYLWCQGNDFKNENVSFMCSIADIYFKLFHFTGFIGVIKLDDEEIKFTTYNEAKIVKYEINEEDVSIVLKKGKYLLDINAIYDKGQKLAAPVKGTMKKDVFESIATDVCVTLKENNEVIFSDTSKLCGLEIVN